MTYPFVGTTPRIMKEILRVKEKNDNEFCITTIVEEEVGSKVYPTLLHFTASDPTLHISDPKIVQALYTTHNKYFDKHPIVRDVTMQLTGRSILFADTGPEWRKRRTAFTPAFYKGKLVQMVELAKDSVRTTINRWKEINGGQPRKQFNFMEEM